MDNVILISLYSLSLIYITRLLCLDTNFIRVNENDWVEHSGHLRPFNYLDYFRIYFIGYSKDVYTEYEGDGANKLKTHFILVENNRLFLLSCPYCLSFWINILALPLFNIFILNDLSLVVLMIFSIPFIVGRVLADE